MSVTNDERRAVAKRLREHIGKPLFTGQDLEDIMGAQRSDFNPILGDVSYRRLADLIEPGPQCPYYSDERHWCSIHDIETERTCRIDMPVIDWETGETDYRCSSCGFSADPQYWAETYVYCPNCGAKVTEVGQ